MKFTARKTFIPIYLLSVLGVLLASPTLAQNTNYTRRQITTEATDHKWPSLNNHGDTVWCQQVGGRWHVFLNGTQITSGDNDYRFPVISDNGDIVYTKYGIGGGIGRQVIKHPNTVIEFSSRDNLSGAHRDAGEHSGIASDGTIIWYFDFFNPFQVRRFNVSGIGRIGNDFTGFDYPDINKQGVIVYSAGSVYKATTQNPHATTFVANGSRPRIADSVNGADPEIIYISSNQVKSTIGGTVDDGTDGACFSADVNNAGDVLYEKQFNGVTQIFLTQRSCPFGKPTVDTVKMAGPHLLQIEVAGHFSNDPATSKSLSVSTTLNGTLLDASTCADCTWSVPNGSTGDIQHTFQIDLNNASVPRFVDNQHFSITATTQDGNDTCSSDAMPAIIPLPVVFVPGIFNSLGGDNVFRNVYSYLESASDSRLRTANVLGEGYRSSNTSSYRTLYALQYDTTNASFQEGATALSVLIFFTVRDKTHADRVQIASHSKGGLVTRKYIVSGGKDYVKWHIMTAPPNTGSWWAAAGANLLNRNLNNLRPTWTWYRITALQRYIATQENQELRALNQIPIPHTDSTGREIRYTIVFSASNDTQAAFTWSGFFWRSVPGDDIVTASSARGYLTDMNNPTVLGPRIAAFDNNIEELSVPGTHSGYMDQLSVMQIILDRFFGNP